MKNSVTGKILFFLFRLLVPMLYIIFIHNDIILILGFIEIAS